MCFFNRTENLWAVLLYHKECREVPGAVEKLQMVTGIVVYHLFKIHLFFSCIHLYYTQICQRSNELSDNQKNIVLYFYLEKYSGISNLK